MAMPEKNIVGVYESEQAAIAAIEDLLTIGYNKEEICVIGKNLKNVNHVTEETGTVAEETAATGAITGGAFGGVTGLLVGIGALAIPGIGPIVAAGPIATSIIGALTGVGLGGLTGALIGLGVSDDEAEYYGNSVEEGKILVLVQKRKYPANDMAGMNHETPPEMDTTPDQERGSMENEFTTFKDRNPFLNNKL